MTHEDLREALSDVRDMAERAMRSAPRGDHEQKTAFNRIRLRAEIGLMAVGEEGEAVVCQWFAGCVRLAAGAVQHPILGKVPCCEQCAANLDLEMVR